MLHLIAFTAALVLSGGPGVQRSYHETEILTRAAPSANPLVTANLGVRLLGAQGYRVTICADVTTSNTLAGAGTVDIYYYSISSFAPQKWSFNKQLQETVSVTATSCGGAACQCQTFGDHFVPATVDGYIEVASNGVTVSAGSNVDLYIETWGVN